MKPHYLLKVIIGFIIFLSCHQVFGQNTFQIQYDNCTTNCAINRGDQTGIPVKLKISNSSGTFMNGVYKLSLSQGLYYKSLISSSNPNVSVSLNTNFNDLEIQISNIPSAAVSVEIDFSVWAGQCLSILDGTVLTNVSNAFTLVNITNPSTPVSIPLSINNLIVNKGQFLVPGNSVHGTVNANRQVVFSYPLNNSFNSIFHGIFSIQSTTTTSSFDIRELHFFITVNGVKEEIQGTALFNPVINTVPDQNDNTFITSSARTIDLDLPLGALLTVEETILINGCTSLDHITSSYMELNWGNTSYDRDCHAPVLIEATIDAVTFAPTFVVDKSNALSNHACFGDDNTGGQQRSVKLTNNGNDIAYNVMLRFSAGEKSPILIPSGTNGSNIFVRVTHTENGVTTTSANIPVNIANHSINYSTKYTASTIPSFASGLVPAYLDANGEISGYDIYKRRNIIDNNRIPVNGIFSAKELTTQVNVATAPFSLSCVGGENTQLVYTLFIDELIINGAPQKINLSPGDGIELFWTEYNCCLFESGIAKQVLSPEVAALYYTACNMTTTSSVALITSGDGNVTPNDINTNYNITLTALSNPATTSGDIDRCLSTHDGAVERISAKLESYIESPAHMSNNPNGKVVFRIYLQNGLDLDKALTRPATNNSWAYNGYDNITDQNTFAQNSSTGCDNSCNPSTCDLTHVLANPSYYFSIRPAIGNPIISTNGTLLLNDNISVVAGQPIPSSVDPRLTYNGIHANYLYEVTFNIEDLVNAYIQNGGYTGFGHLQMLSEYLNNAQISFDLRAYCTDIEMPSYSVVMLIDRCTGVESDYQIVGCAENGLTNMVPVTSFTGNILINCPGCQIPGANINSASLFRAENSRGIEDINRDNIADVSGLKLPDAHPTMRIATTGDEMVCTFSASMSDGNGDPSVGITQSQLESFSTPYYLDNFYLKITLGTIINGSSIPMQAGAVNLIKVEINGIDHTASIVSSTAGLIVLRVSSQSLYPSSSSNNSFTIYSTINCKLTFRIDGQISSVVSFPSIALTPAFSPCDNCTDFDAMTDANPAAGVITYYDAEHITPFGESTRWTCTGFTSVFQYVPYVRESTMGIDNISSCKKVIVTKFSGAFNPPISDPDSDMRLDYFPEEFRTFLGENILLQVPIPLGYTPVEVVINNYTQQPNKTQIVQDNYTITDPTVIHSILTNTSQTNYPQQLNFTIAPSSTVDIANEFDKYDNSGRDIYNREASNILPDGNNGHYLALSDEHYIISVTVYLYKDPEVSCADGMSTYNVVLEDYYLNHTFPLATNVPAQTDDAALAVAFNPHTPLGTLKEFKPKNIQYGACLPCINLYEPNAVGKLTGIKIGGTTRTVNTGIYQLPIVIRNDWSGANGLNVWEIPHPYLRIYGEALAQGLVLEGIYLGDPVANTGQIPYYNYSNSISSDLQTQGIIVGIDQTSASNAHSNPFLAGSGSKSYVDYKYTLVFSYSCSEECNISQGCGTEGTYQPCLSAGNNLFVEYGWDCNENVTFNNIDNICGKYGPLEYNFQNGPVGLDMIVQGEDSQDNSEIIIQESDPIELNFCQDYNYKIKINSCRSGGFTGYAINFSGVPEGVTITSVTTTAIALGLDQSISPISFNISSNPNVINTFYLTCGGCNMSNQNPVLEVEFKINASEYFVPGVITSTVSGVSYCGSSVLLSQTNPISINSIFPGLSNGYCVSSPNVLIDPISAMQGGTYSFPSSSAGFTNNGDGTLTFAPSTGVGVYSFEYHVPNSTCVVLYTINVNSSLRVNITPPDGIATILCGGHTSSDLTAHTNDGTSPYSYSWTVPAGASALPATQTVTANHVGVYTVTVTDNNSCSGTASVELKDKVDPICPAPFCEGASPKLQINMGGVTGSYSVQWYEANALDPDDMSNPVSSFINHEGDYYGWVVTPACTLRTETPCHITFLPKPPAYTITANGSLNVLPDGTVDITGTAPSTTTGIASATWSNGTNIDPLSTPGTITASHAGPYSITSVGVNGCTNVSNVLVVNKPELFVFGGNCGSDVLSVSSNTQASTYVWYFDDGSGQQPVPLTDYIDPSGNSIHAHYNGYYWVENSSGIVSATYYSVTYIAPLNPGQNILSSAEGSFAGISSGSSSSVIGSAYVSFDQFPALSTYTPAPPAGSTPEGIYDYLLMPGHYIIVPDAATDPIKSNAGYWNRSLWNAAPMNVLSDDNYMIIDGKADAASYNVWSKSNVSVTHNQYYKFSASIMGIDIQSLLPVGNQFEFPDYELHITRSWDSGTDVVKGQVFYTYNNNQYIDIEGIWKADMSSVTNPTGGTVTLAIVLKGGGVLGRDVAIDNVIFAPMDCPVSPATSLNPQVQNDRTCSALATVDVKHKYTCSGMPVRFEVPEYLYNSALKYTWHSETDDIISSLSLDNDNDRYFNAPAASGNYVLKVKDVANNCFAIEEFYVHVITPSLQISSNVTTVCSPQDVTYQVEGYDGILGSQYKWYVNNNPVATNSTGTYTVLNASSATVVKCQLISGCTGGAVFSNVVTLSGVQSAVNAGTDATICAGENTQLNASGAVTYTWTADASLSATNVANPTATSAATKTYTVTGTDVNGCTSTDQVVVTVNSLPTVNAGTDVAVCFGTPVQLTASGASSYSWSPTTGLSNPTSASTSVSGAMLTTYTVTGTAANGCVNTDQVVVRITPLPTINAGTDATICNGSSTTLNGSGGGTWSPSTGLSSTTAYNPTASPTSSITYTYTVSGAWGCTNSDQVVVTVNNCVANTNIGSAYCGVSYSITSGSIFPVTVSGASMYEYKLVDASNNTFLKQTTGGLLLNTITSPSLSWGTTYTVYVRAKVGVNWGSFSTSCTISTVPDPVNGVPNTNVISNYCGVSYSITSGAIFPVAVAGVSMYEYKLVDPSNNIILKQTVNGLVFNTITSPSLAWGTTYTVYVRAQVGGYWGAFSTSCTITTVPDPANGVPSTNVNSLYCNKQYSITDGSIFPVAVAGVSMYEYKLVDPSNNIILKQTAGGLVFNTITSPSLSWGTTYTVYVRAQVGGYWGTFGTPCTITTVPDPANGVPDTYLPSSYCNRSYSISSNTVFPNAVAGSNQFEYKLVSSTNTVYLKQTGNGLVLNTVTNPSLVPGTYTVYVRARISTYWGSFSTPCTITLTSPRMSYADYDGKIIVYPVPAHDLLNVEYNSDTTLSNLVMYDALGREILRQDINSNKSVVDVHNIPAGVYVIHFVDGRNIMHTKRVEVIH